MKKILIIAIIIINIITLAAGCSSQGKIFNNNSENNKSEEITYESSQNTTSETEGSINNEIDTEIKNETNDELSEEERQRIDLYVSVMKAAFKKENGGNGFIAVKLDTLEGLNDLAKEEVLNEFKILSANVCDYEDIKDDDTKFSFDNEGRKTRTLNGTLLWIDLEEYNENKAVITGVSWFSNTGAVFPKYEAIYKNGKWTLNLISMAISWAQHGNSLNMTITKKKRLNQSQQIDLLIKD